MKKKEVVRDYKFSDAKLVITTKEKIAFIRRDKIEFEGYGITIELVDELEALANAFSDSATDVEFVEAQVEVTTAKDVIADKLREAIRTVMSRVVLKYEVQTAKYKKFGTETLSRQSDAQLILIAGRVFRVGTEMLAELAANGLTAAMLNNIKSLRDDLEHEIISMNLKIADRDIEQESRVEAGNVIYAILMKYTATGQSIWATSNVAKYNDYVVYNTPTGEAPDVPTPPVG